MLEDDATARFTPAQIGWLPVLILSLTGVGRVWAENRLPAPGTYAVASRDEPSRHTFVIERPALLDVEVEPTGFAAAVAVLDERTGEELARTQAPPFETARVLAWLAAPGEFVLSIEVDTAWKPALGYQLRVSARDAEPAPGEPLLRREGPLDGSNTDPGEPQPVKVTGVRVPGLLEPRPLLLEITSGQGQLFLLDPADLVVAGLEPGSRSGDGRRLFLDGNAGTQLFVRTSDSKGTVALRSVDVRTWNEGKTLDGELTEESAPGTREHVGRSFPLTVPRGASLVARAASPDAVLELLALDGNGQVLARGSEQETGEAPEFSLPGEANRPTRLVVAASDDTPGQYQVHVSATTPSTIPLATAQPLVVGPDTSPLAVAGRMWRVPVPEPARVTVSFAAAAGQLLAADAEGRWLAIGEQRRGSDLAVGDEMLLRSREDADLSALGGPGIDELIKEGARVKIVRLSDDDEVALVVSGEVKALVAVAGLERASPPVPELRLELDREASGDLFVVFLGPAPGSPHVVRHVTQELLSRNETFDADARVSSINRTLVMAKHPVWLAQSELVEATLVSAELDEARLSLVRSDGSRVASVLGVAVPGTPLRLRALSRDAGDYALEVGNTGEGIGSYRLSWRTGVARTSERQIDLRTASRHELKIPGRGRARRIEIRAAPNDVVLLRFEAEGAGSFRLQLRGAPDRVTARAAGEEDHVTLVARVGADGVAEAVATTEDDARRTTLEVRRLVLGDPIAVPAPVAAEIASERKKAPDFEFVDAGGRRMRLADLRNRVVMLDFWASWCGPCKRTLPHVEALHTRLGERGLYVLGVNDEEQETMARFRQRMGLTFHTTLDEGKRIGKLYGVNAIPRTLLIDAEGYVLADINGATEPELLDRLSEAALQDLGRRSEAN